MVPRGALALVYLGEPRAALIRSAWAGATERLRGAERTGGEMVRRGAEDDTMYSKVLRLDSIYKIWESEQLTGTS